MTCQSCQSPTRPILDMGFLPAVNDMQPIGEPRRATKTYPTELVYCDACELLQLGHVPPQEETFPASYPYRSSTTAILRENFRELFEHVQQFGTLHPGDVVIDIGGNDGNLLSFAPSHCSRINVTPEDMGALGQAFGVAHERAYWTEPFARALRDDYGAAKLITATNVFAHVPDPNDFLRGVTECLAPDGLLVLENHDVQSVLAGQWDTIYGEHVRYNCRNSVQKILMRHGLTPIDCRKIPTHGGSFRIVACRADVAARYEPVVQWDAPLSFDGFADRCARSRREIRRGMCNLKDSWQTTWAVGAPSRGTTLLAYCGLTHEDVACVLEVDGSAKVGKYMPGTSIPVIAETSVNEWPDALLILSHHVADAMKARMRELGFHGKFIVPLPEVRVEE